MFRRMILKSNLCLVHHDTENLRCAAGVLRPVAGTLSPATDQRILGWQHRRAVRRAEAGRAVRLDQRPASDPTNLINAINRYFGQSDRRRRSALTRTRACGLRSEEHTSELQS